MPLRGPFKNRNPTVYFTTSTVQNHIYLFILKVSGEYLFFDYSVWIPPPPSNKNKLFEFHFLPIHKLTIEKHLKELINIFSSLSDIVWTIIVVWYDKLYGKPVVVVVVWNIHVQTWPQISFGGEKKDENRWVALFLFFSVWRVYSTAIIIYVQSLDCDILR